MTGVRVPDSQTDFLKYRLSGFLCRISQINFQYMQEYHTMEFREVPEGLGKGKIQKIKIQLLYENPDPMGTIVLVVKIRIEEPTCHLQSKLIAHPI